MAPFLTPAFLMPAFQRHRATLRGIDPCSDLKQIQFPTHL